MYTILDFREFHMLIDECVDTLHFSRRTNGICSWGWSHSSHKHKSFDGIFLFTLSCGRSLSHMAHALHTHRVRSERWTVCDLMTGSTWRPMADVCIHTYANTQFNIYYCLANIPIIDENRFHLNCDMCPAVGQTPNNLQSFRVTVLSADSGKVNSLVSLLSVRIFKINYRLQCDSFNSFVVI